jgi:hypothetical protein
MLLQTLSCLGCLPAPGLAQHAAHCCRLLVGPPGLLCLLLLPGWLLLPRPHPAHQLQLQRADSGSQVCLCACLCCADPALLPRQTAPPHHCHPATPGQQVA